MSIVKEMKQLLFSVLIANYNNGKYLMEAIESVRQQTYANWEIVLVDDASTDNSEEMYAEFEKDERIHIYRNEKNMGCGYTKRRCAELAKGEICGFLDPDDVLLPNAIEDSVQNLLTHPNSSLSFSRFYFCDADMNITGECRVLDLHKKSYFENQDYCPEHFVAFRKEAYDKTAGIDALLKAGVDQDLYFRLEEVGEIAIMDKFTYKYRIVDGSVSREDRKSYFWNQVARINTCERRGLPVDKFVYPDFVAFCEHENKSGAEMVRNSKAYKVGRWLTGLFKK